MAREEVRAERSVLGGRVEVDIFDLWGPPTYGWFGGWKRVPVELEERAFYVVGCAIDVDKSEDMFAVVLGWTRWLGRSCAKQRWVVMESCSSCRSSGVWRWPVAV